MYFSPHVIISLNVSWLFFDRRLEESRGKAIGDQHLSELENFLGNYRVSEIVTLSDLCVQVGRFLLGVSFNPWLVHALAFCYQLLYVLYILTERHVIVVILFCRCLVSRSTCHSQRSTQSLSPCLPQVFTHRNPVMWSMPWLFMFILTQIPSSLCGCTLPP